MIKLPSRQVHLDFHTSELIPDVGRYFDKKQWQHALQLGHLNSITVFAKCHHSWSYYPTRVGKPHPHLQRNLLKEQIEASHEVGVRAPIYYTVGWSATDAETHPEWVARNKDGSLQTTNYDVNAGANDTKPTTSWKNLCPSGAYKELMLAQTREICEQFIVDGFFYDICFRDPCYCDQCMAGMQAMGLNASADENARAYNKHKWQSFMADCNAIILSQYPEATIFYNGGASQYHPEWHVGDTHFELEDLPTTWGGYDKFPIRAKYFANTGKDYLAMSGKFHTHWGEFGGFKHPDAITFEAACMLAYGSRCSFGDQLHPNGVMDLATYENIGAAYAYVEQIEAYGLDGHPYANLGVWMTGSVADDQGVVNMLMESQIDFEVVNPRSELTRYETIVLTGGQCLNAPDAQLLENYLAQGGHLVVLGESGLNSSKTAFLLDCGARYMGDAQFTLDYTVVSDEINEGIVSTPFLNYTGAIRAELTDAIALAAVRVPYFDRTYGHYCSHMNTPYTDVNAPHPAVWRKGNITCLAHKLGSIYYQHGARMHRQLFINALRQQYTKPIVQAQLPSAGRMNVIHQPDQQRYVVHLMYAPPLQRGRCLVIEDMPDLFDVPVQLLVPEHVTKVFLAPSGILLDLGNTEAAQVVVPRVHGHQAVVFSYAA